MTDGTLRLATTPEERSTLRAEIFRQSADEIAKIDQHCGPVNKGLTEVALDSIKKALGRSPREFSRSEGGVVSLIVEAAKDVSPVRFRNSTHVYDFLSAKLKQDVCSMTLDDRKFAEAFVRRISEKLRNGHAGVVI